MSTKDIATKIAFAMDGVVLTLPPADPVDRENYCHYGETHMYRKRGDATKPSLAGGDAWSEQVPLQRIVPMWAGVGWRGFGLVVFHKKRKLNGAEWATAVRSGKLVKACRQANGGEGVGPWRILCDNESFLDTGVCGEEYKKANVKLNHIPPHSPDLNPAEKFWSWLRQRLRAMDLADLKAKRKPAQRSAFKARVRSLCRSSRGQRVARNCMNGLRRACREVVQKRGAATRG